MYLRGEATYLNQFGQVGQDDAWPRHVMSVANVVGGAVEPGGISPMQDQGRAVRG
jgi:hypothetical protein